MFSPTLVALLSLLYVGVLFAIAWYGDRIPDRRIRGRLRAVIYSLSLAVYCTSWTFFGAVGSAVTDGWLFATIYLGPILVVLLGHDLMQRILKLSHEQRLTSIADFLAYRFGKSRRLAVLITVAAVLGSIPYIALQLKAVTEGLMVITDRPVGLPESGLALVLALALGGFSILFGVRRLEASEHHRGMVLAIAFESLVKLVAFAVVGIWALFWLLDGPAGLVAIVSEQPHYRRLFLPDGLPQAFWTQTLLAAAAVVCLPRQFQVAFVENERRGDLELARWLFPAYLLLFTVLVVPIAVAGMQRFGIESPKADMFVLALPLADGHGVIALLSFLGGFSAATGMVIVASVALATMVSNELIVPLLMRMGVQRGPDFGRVLLNSRRITIIALSLAGWAFYLALRDTEALAAIGLMAFAAVVQFAPGLVGGVYWQRASREGVTIGLLLGLIGWLLLVFAPSIISAWPRVLDPGIHHATAVTLALNVTALVVISIWVRRHRPTLPMLLGRRNALRPVSIGELSRIAASFIGEQRVELAFAGVLGGDGSFDRAVYEDQPATAEMLVFTERLLAGCIGSASARSVLTAGLRQSGMETRDALLLLEHTSSAIQFNRELLEGTLDHISQGVSVVDGNLRLVSWNRAYLELLDYPTGQVYLGQPIEDLIRFNLEREFGPGEEVEAAIDRRMHHMRRGTPYVFERRHGDGRVIEIRGNSMPHGGYVTTFTDITGFKQTEAELKAAYATMEQQVTRRTRELHATMQALELAKQDAERANHSKSRFLAAASHDLLQPLNAARLFSANLSERAKRFSPDDARLVHRLDHSLGVAEELLSALLDISRLDQGALQPQWLDVPVNQLLEKVERQFSALAERRGLRLRVRRNPGYIRTDPKLLQRILFNLVNNALRYTRHGGVLVGCRVRGERLMLQVWDTGQGIAASEQERIFEEFERLETDQHDGDSEFDQGLGLGLSICRRISQMLDAGLALDSRPGRGSVFSVSVPRRSSSDPVAPLQSRGDARAANDLVGLSVLVIDDDPEILDGMQLLLRRWGCRVTLVSDAQRCDTVALPDIVLADFHLAGGETGLDACLRLQRRADRPIPVILLTADRSDALGARVEQLGYQRLFKPVKPAALRALMLHLAVADGDGPVPD
ncbi:MAG: PAS domain-containing hybrid sensor histidine kinase/response regulator [Wenzhouxiangellaceae bacterium]|nr:PAS domain-containing hybrid sensor histidine kinase/response regulator [Wenzhouxiangellaceae bacterium]